MVEVISVELIRDGGSLAVAFSDTAADHWWLFFELQTEIDELTRTPGSVDRVRTGYGPPVLWRRTTNRSKDTISWHDAVAFLNDIEPQLPDHLHTRKWWQAMLRVAQSEGAPLPDDPALGPPRRTSYSSHSAMRAARKGEQSP